IASLIVMGADEVVMNECALMMLHAPWGTLLVDGNAKKVREFADEFASQLDVFGRAMSAAYARKTGKAATEFDAMWAAGTDFFYTAEEALAFGLCDRIGTDVPSYASAAAWAPAAVAGIISEVAARAPKHAAHVRAALSLPQPATAGTNHGESAMPNNSDAQRQEIIAAERDRVAEIRAMAEIGMEGARGPHVRRAMDEAVSSGMSAADFG